MKIVKNIKLESFREQEYYLFKAVMQKGLVKTN